MVAVDVVAENLGVLETEQINPRTRSLDQVSTRELVELLQHENRQVAAAVDSTLDEVSALVDLISDRLARGGRLFYVGAGTSGRLGVLDASECPPTFGVEPDLVQGIIAGGTTALTSSIEGAEDEPEFGSHDLVERGVGPLDVVVGIAASGRTPYVIGALVAARSVGAVTAAVVNVSHSRLAQYADITIAAVTGPEALTGSTRLKAGTAQKLVLNLLTTAAMVRLGKVYGNLMVDVRAVNAKLRDRAARIVVAATNVSREQAEISLEEANWQVKPAIVMLLANVTAEEAHERLTRAKGWVHSAIQEEP